MRPKGTARPHDVNRFQQTRFSTAVQADKEVDAWRKLNVYAVENPEMTDLDGFDTHDLDFAFADIDRSVGASDAPQSRIGITTN